MADLQGLIQRLALHLLCSQRGGSNCRAAAIGLEAHIFDDTRSVNPYLQLDDIAFVGGAHHTGAHLPVRRVKRADISWITEVIQYLIAVSHRVRVLYFCI